MEPLNLARAKARRHQALLGRDERAQHRPMQPESDALLRDFWEVGSCESEDQNNDGKHALMAAPRALRLRNVRRHSALSSHPAGLRNQDGAVLVQVVENSARPSHHTREWFFVHVNREVGLVLE